MTDASSHIRDEANYLALWQQQTNAGKPRHAEDKKSQDAGAVGLYGRATREKGEPSPAQIKAEAQRNAADMRVILAGVKAWRDINFNCSLEKWRAVGAALNVGREQALRETKQNNTIGGKYTKALGKWIQENGFEGMAKNTRCWTLTLFDKYAEVSQWWNNLELYHRRRLLAPQSILSAYRAATTPPRPIDLRRNALSGFRKFMSAFKRMKETDAAALLAELRDEIMPLVMQ
jgi:hypothetical protein